MATSMTRGRRRLVVLAVLVIGIGVGGVAPLVAEASDTTTAAEECVARKLVLSAYPAEADAVLARMMLDADPVEVVDGHHFYLGTMGGVPVASAMTGIGLANAAATTEAALRGLTCAATGSSVDAVLFSGVAGGADRTAIGDVAVPARWTLDDGATWRGVDPSLLEAAASVFTTSPPILEHVNSLGDPLCACIDPHLVPLVDLGRQPVIHVGGDGASSDSLQGQQSPCIPGAGDTFGCEPCTAPDRGLPDLVATGPALVLFLQRYMGGTNPLPAASGNVYDAVDQETAAVQVVADEHGVPFLGFRGMSDGPGDPLHLPGFPFQFFVYKQIAADNAAIALEAFLASTA